IHYRFQARQPPPDAVQVDAPNHYPSTHKQQQDVGGRTYPLEVRRGRDILWQLGRRRRSLKNEQKADRKYDHAYPGAHAVVSLDLQEDEYGADEHQEHSDY